MLEIRLKDPEDKEMKSCLRNATEQLALEEDSGILEVVDREDTRARGGFPLAEYVLVSQKGYEVRDNVNGSYCTIKLHQKAQHGYSENFEGVRTSFILEGGGVQAGDDLGVMDLIDIMPTLAALTSLELLDIEETCVLG